MGDFERYGDYNEIDESPKKGIVGRILKIFIVVLCLGIFAFLIFRVVIFNHYPKSMKKIYFTEELTAYYNEASGEIGALTQDMLNSNSYGYDDAKEGNFFCKYFVYIPATEELQVTLKYNTSLMKNIEEKYGVSLDANAEDNFTFRLVAVRANDNLDENLPAEELGTPLNATLVASEYDSFLMYRYVRLCFDGVDLSVGEEDAIDWIRLEVTVKGLENEKPYMIAIYLNDEENFPLTPYKLSAKETP